MHRNLTELENGLNRVSSEKTSLHSQPASRSNDRLDRAPVTFNHTFASGVELA